MSDPRGQGLTLLLPLRAGAEAELRAALARTADAFLQALSSSETVHFARFVVLPARPDEGREASTLFFESTFDGELETHLMELCHVAGAELREVLSHCENFRPECSTAQLEEFLRRSRFVASAAIGPHPRRRAQRIRDEARLHRDVLAVLSRDRAILAARSAQQIMEHVRREVRRPLPPPLRDDAGLTAQTSVLRASRAESYFWLAWVLLSTLFFDGLALLSRLWHEASNASERAPHADPPETAAGDAAITRPVQNAYTHVVALKPGAFRRRALRRLLSLLSRGDDADRLARDIRGLHGARFVLTADGFLLFTAQHDGSPIARMAELGLVQRLFMLVLWSSTRAVPDIAASLRSFSRNGERVRTWANEYEVLPALAYSAYPMLTVADVTRNAELCRLLASEPTAEDAERALALV